MDYISVKQATEKWKISERRIQKLCECGRIDGVLRFGALLDDSKRCRKTERQTEEGNKRACSVRGVEILMYNPQLETFLCVVECGSFNKAAEKLYISPPAVIKQINLLEENLNLQLFVRTHRGLHITEAGKSLAQDAKYIIQYCKDSVTRAKNAMQKDEEIIRIGTSPMTPAQVLVDLWPKLQGGLSGVSNFS